MFEKIKFERTPCYGTYPSFDVEVTRDGTVKWKGHMYVYQIGDIEFKITKKTIDKIDHLLREFDFRTFIYPAADIYATDHPSCMTRVVYADGYVKEVDHYLGDLESHDSNEKHTLKNLEKFEKNLEQILGLRKYINPTLYLYHLKVEEDGYRISAPNEGSAMNLVGYTWKRGQFDIEKIGRDTTGEVLPYIVMGQNKNNR